MLAQSHSPNAYQFSAPAQAVIQRLSSFGALDARDWQWHEGPVEHGESPDLDTSSWKNVRLPFYASPKELWLRRWIEIPKTLNGYDLTGTRITFKIDVGGFGPGRGYLYETIYFNGHRVDEGTYLARRTLIESAKPGDKVLIAVHMPLTYEVKHFEGASVEVNFLSKRPNPAALATELVSAAQLLPTIVKDPADLTSQENLLDSAATSVSLASLDGDDQSAFDTSLIKAQAALEPLKPLLKKFFIQLTGDAHIDAAWLWTASEAVDQVRFTFSSALQMMREYPQYTLSQSSAQYYEWMEEKFPGIFAEIQKRVKEGRWELVGGMWVEPDLNMTDGESQVRQLLLGKRYFQQKFNVDVKIGWNVDSFGYDWQLPQIYKKSGIDYFITQKLRYNDTNPLPLKLFWWQSPDGSRVLSYFPHDIVQGTEADEMARDLAVAIKLNPGQQELMHVYGPSLGRLNITGARESIENGIDWSNPNRIYPRVEFRTSQSFFNDMNSHIATTGMPVWNYKTLAAGDTHLPVQSDGRIHLPVWNDEIYLEHHRGTFTSQAAQKANMRHSDEWLLDAEKYSSLAWLGGLEYPGEQLTEAWKKKAFNEFHDVAAGTAIAPVYKDAQKDYDEAHRIAYEATSNALRELNSHINTAMHPGVPIVVWNPLSWDRSGMVTVSVQMPQPTPNGISVLDADNKPVLVQVLSKDEATNTYHLLLRPGNVPSVGYTVLHAVPGQRKVTSDLALRGTTMENAFLRVTLDPKTGCITSLYQKKVKFESIVPGQCGNKLETFVDTGRSLTEHNLDSIRVEDAWNIDKDYDKQETDLLALSSIETIERGPLREIIRITRHWSKSTFVQDITLYASTPHVDVVNNIDWHETHVLLKASFPLTATSSAATYEIPYGSIERSTSRNNPVDAARFEVPALRWADLGDSEHGFSLINDSKYGYDALGNVLRLSLLRAPLYPDPTADRGHQHFTYSLYPHPGSWKKAETVLRAYEFNYPMQSFQVEAHTGDLPAKHSLVRVAPDTLVLTAMKKSEDGDSLILRFYEWAGEDTHAKITVPFGASRVLETNLMEQDLKEANTKVTFHKGEIDLDAGPYSINTVRLLYPAHGKSFWQVQGTSHNGSRRLTRSEEN
ncbi:glycoside hydrolase family 38 C-terminal domain-containing protein [Edaphobacter sp. 12200R-103]|uniref:alpha-mannosidase n=1 Tax=Edaphobacter sp. 12200R-103 TaxID=2703788 RepID=UPI00138B76F1|nr:glycoside hydrolase family 38 C-terminal domain-containing protein [Edaphobacter sp. 12200R-103]QHS51610.1 alpha-mannosidase [Edaphobacter sp. 12200R-103]